MIGALPTHYSASLPAWSPTETSVTLGATLYRGPMKIEGGEWMCQVRDPWGNCIGLRQAGLDK
ncbi:MULTISPECIES: VOC family protein [unclassified Pseudomonas]|uniref:VOC family protein n=1 Tax=unclassified Pseudomonas TaxID=196821 RepID=UPI002114D614|nr:MULTISPECIES: hypothetical protein [unclassified Pseudomonas]MDY0831642.1 hypothetical protein [Pseudomonas sp. SED1]